MLFRSLWRRVMAKALAAWARTTMKSFGSFGPFGSFGSFIRSRSVSRLLLAVLSCATCSSPTSPPKRTVPAAESEGLCFVQFEAGYLDIISMIGEHRRVQLPADVSPEQGVRSGSISPDGTWVAAAACATGRADALVGIGRDGREWWRVATAPARTLAIGQDGTRVAFAERNDPNVPNDSNEPNVS